jgi:hypothetical protein
MPPQDSVPPGQMPAPPSDNPYGFITNQTLPGPAPKGGRRKRILAIVVTVLIVSVLFGLWAALQGTTPGSETNPPAGDAAGQQPSLQPKGVAYASGDPADTGVTLRLGALDSDQFTTSQTLGKSIFISDWAVYQNQVAVATAPGTAGAEGFTVRYSQDAGKSFKTILSAAPPERSNLGDQITSIKFSDDGTKLILAYVAETATQNTVKELDPATKATKDLFSVIEKGVLIQGYSPSKKEVYYYAGCFACGGNKSGRLMKRDLSTGAETIAYEDFTYTSVQTVLSRDFSHALMLLSGTTRGSGGPYEVVEVDLKTKSLTNMLANYTDGTDYPKIGYMDDGKTAYYTRGKSLYQHKDGKATALFTSPQEEFLDVYFVGSKSAIVSFGSYESSTVSNLDLTSKGATSLFKGDKNTYVFGITSQ